METGLCHSGKLPGASNVQLGVRSLTKWLSKLLLGANVLWSFCPFLWPEHARGTEDVMQIFPAPHSPWQCGFVALYKVKRTSSLLGIEQEPGPDLQDTR